MDNKKLIEQLQKLGREISKQSCSVRSKLVNLWAILEIRMVENDTKEEKYQFRKCFFVIVISLILVLVMMIIISKFFGMTI